MRAVAVLSLVLALSSGMAWGGAEAAPLEHCVKAEAAYQAGDHTLEIEYYTRCIDDEGPASATRAIAHNNRGVAHLAAGDPDSAIADYEKALSLDSAYAMAYANRGMAQLAKGNFVQSLRDYDTALDFDPAYAPAYTNRCWLFGFMGYGEAALEDCDESLRLRPDDSFTLDARAFAFWLLEDQEKSVSPNSRRSSRSATLTRPPPSSRPTARPKPTKRRYSKRPADRRRARTD
jgi:tetratricopeptide (TPR) repeat protein